MRSATKVYKWGTFVTFVLKVSVKDKSNPILDGVAKALFNGNLQRRNRAASPVRPPIGLVELRESWLLPQEVNRLDIMQQWLLSWDPEASKAVKKRNLSLSQKVKKFGWKQAMRDEANEIWRGLASVGGRPSLSEISKELHKRAAAFNVATASGITPSAGYIKNHIISKRYWTPPR